VNIVICVSVEG